MGKQKMPDKDTTVITDPIPDSELHPEKNYDFDFNNLGGDVEVKSEDEPEVKKDDELKPEIKPEIISPKEEKKSETLPEVESYKSRISELEASLAERETSIKKYTEDINKYANTKAAMDEFIKEPLVFIRKYVPQIAETINPEKYITDKLRGEFSADFRYDANEAFEEGTESYKYRLRYEELKDTIRREQQQHELQQATVRSKQEASFDSDKKFVMDTYKLDEKKFNELQEWAKVTPTSPKHWAMIKYHDEIIKKAVDDALATAKGRKTSDAPPIPGVAGLHGDDERTIPEHIKELDDVFGDIA